ncbi:hypothetical protein BAUCODRAFT_34766 [Baudoinia panamericana UAMH 10762]|uniref:Uncharacterized protein n=1 Tax=Baudoinia panamericana (strain UAMH 10762) TaxID=717646 RepID=M2MHE1_BAUPA|nr:uncharacterized protein BAUCODRAFT_34766 [Baudoinia panamericana UAMH 10762]EMC96001.1 hypothetical protein BAUCODRAFT_34766 [Baudoinia panamericana UAMH 10762]
MLLTLSQPAKTECGYRPSHDYSPRLPPVTKSRASPKPKVDTAVSSLRVSVTADDMSTGHRGLPPPAAMALPEPNRQPPLLNQPLGAMPNPPNQWQGHEESMRNWLVAKAEEDKRKQEEEKTRQEGYRLEQRRIELQMLHDSLQAGVPPSMVPMIYAGIGGANLANVSIDWLQQYAAQLQAAQQQLQQQTAPDYRRETRLIGSNPAPYGAPQQAQPIVAAQPLHPSQPNASIQTTFPAYEPATSARGPQSAAPRSAHTQLPRLTTNEMFIQQPPAGNPGSAHPLQQTQTMQQDQPASSPALYFHHWVPPNEAKVQPQTPASRGEPLSAHPGSHASEGEYKESPRKRKAQGGHQANPPPSTSPSFGSAAAGSRRRGGHSRTRSNASLRESEGRPGSRREAESSQPEPTEERRPPDLLRHRDERSTRSSDEGPGEPHYEPR